MDYILEVNNLNKSFKEFSLRDVNLKIKKGTIMGLIGENGAGKTTCIKSILDIVKKDSGQVKIFDQDFNDDSLDLKEDIGVVLDGAFFQNNFTVNDIEKIASQAYKNWDSSSFDNYMKKYQLPRDQKIKEFSKGMNMKLAIALALAHHPQLLILDEPTSGLDPVFRLELLDELLEFIQDENKSILFSTHITSDLEKIADHITFLNQGEVVFSQEKDLLMMDYGLIKCGLDQYDLIDREDIIGSKKNKFGYEVMISNKEKNRLKYPDLLVDNISLEEIMFFYLRGEK